MQSLIGNIDARVDAKGRAFLPVQLRKQLGDCKNFIIRKDIFCDCLVMYTEESWNGIITRLRSQINSLNRQQGMVFRQFVSEAERIELEENGRMLIPRRFIDALKIESDVRFIGNDTTIEIWPAGKMEQHFSDPDNFAKALEELMKESKDL